MWEVFVDKGILPKNSKITVSKTALSKLTDNEIVNTYFEYKHLMKLQSSYGKKFYSLVDEDSRIRSDYWQILVTGRISSSKPNLQNIPKEGEFSEFRSCFEAPRGHRFVICDYSSQELRILAEFSNDESLIKLANEGADIHKYVASKMFNVKEEDISKDQRFVAKIINFTIAYGGGPETVASRLNISNKEAKKYIEKYFKTFVNLDKYFKYKLQESLNTGRICIMTGRNSKKYRNIKVDFYDRMMELNKIINNWVDKGWKLHIPSSITREYNKLYAEFARKVQNYPIQGTAASMTKLAAIYITDRLKELVNKNKIKFYKLCLIIHDEFIVECHKDDAKLVSEIVKQSMKDAGKEFCKSVEMDADPAISKYWTKA